MEKTDAIRIVEKIGRRTLGTFITPQLGWTKLKSEQWSFVRYTYINGAEVYYPQPPPHFVYRFIAKLIWGDSSHATRISGVGYISYLDKGVRIKTSSGIIKIGLQELKASHKLRIRKDSTTYGIPLLDTNDNDASPVRIYDGRSIKALPEIKD